MCLYIAVMYLSFSALGIDVIVQKREDMDFSDRDVGGVLIQYPDTDGNIYDLTDIVTQAHANGVSVIFLGHFVFISCERI